MMVRAGDADVVVAGIETHYAETLRTIVESIGPAAGVRRISSHYLVLLPRDVVCLADCAVNVDPTAEELAEIALLAARTARGLGLEPRVALLSSSNFGSADHGSARKVREAARLAPRAREPDLPLDGEMQLAAARDADLRERHFPFARLVGAANVLIFPDLQSGNLALHALQYLGEAVPIGPVLMGTSMPAHVLQYGMSADEVVNLTTLGVVEAGGIADASPTGSCGRSALVTAPRPGRS
jgi:malate dehydrogenase (oxaloacetate-decarboxylating)(NADP+)